MFPFAFIITSICALFPFSWLVSPAVSIFIRLCKELALGLIDSQLIYIIFKVYSLVFNIFFVLLSLGLLCFSFQFLSEMLSSLIFNLSFPI